MHPNSRLPIFVQKVYQLVEDPNLDHLISWNTKGDALVIPDFKRVKHEGLGHYFPGIKYESFRRQLNNYLFTRDVTANPDERVFRHPSFKRGRPELLIAIARAETTQEEARFLLA
jgi:hypothetical protein